MKRILALVLAAVLVLSLAACGGEAAQVSEGSRTLVDGKGREVSVPETVERAVCIGVGALRYSSYLGAADRMVGVEEYEKTQSLSRLYNYVNFDHFQDLSVIGGNGDPYAEAIIDADPQVIVMSFSATADPEELSAQTGIPVVVVPGSDTTLDDNAYETIRILGELYGLEEKAQELEGYLQGIEEDLKQRTQNIPEAEKPEAYVCGVSFKGAHGFEGTEAGYGPFQLIGAKNLADTTGKTGAFDVDLEQVLAWDPEIIFVDYNGLDLIREDYAKNPEYYQSLTAVQAGKVYAQISFRSFASNLDLALVDAYYAGSVMFPEAFADVDMEQKAGEIFEMLLGSNPYEDLKEAGYVFGEVKIG